MYVVQVRSSVNLGGHTAEREQAARSTETGPSRGGASSETVPSKANWSDYEAMTEEARKQAQWIFDQIGVVSSDALVLLSA